MDFSLVQVSSQQKDLKIKFCKKFICSALPRFRPEQCQIVVTNLLERHGRVFGSVFHRYPDSGQSSVRSLLPTFLNVMAEFSGPFFTVKLYAFLPSSHFTRESTRTFSILRDFLCIHTNPEILNFNILTPCLSSCGYKQIFLFSSSSFQHSTWPLLSPQIQQAISRVGKMTLFKLRQCDGSGSGSESIDSPPRMRCQFPAFCQGFSDSSPISFTPLGRKRHRESKVSGPRTKHILVQNLASQRANNMTRMLQGEKKVRYEKREYFQK